jgi:AsnC-type helix-turn-helix domain
MLSGSRSLAHMARIITPPMNAEAGDSGNRGPDATDERILQPLEANGRATYEEIAGLVNLSANADRGSRPRMLDRPGLIEGSCTSPARSASSAARIWTAGG